jgi:hypothetical protein
MPHRRSVALRAKPSRVWPSRITRAAQESSASRLRRPVLRPVTEVFLPRQPVPRRSLQSVLLPVRPSLPRPVLLLVRPSLPRPVLLPVRPSLPRLVLLPVRPTFLRLVQLPVRRAFLRLVPLPVRRTFLRLVPHQVPPKRPVQVRQQVRQLPQLQGPRRRQPSLLPPHLVTQVRPQRSQAQLLALLLAPLPDPQKSQVPVLPLALRKLQLQVLRLGRP